METVKEAKDHMVTKYDLLAEKFHHLYLEGQDRGREAMAKSLETARKQLTAAGEFSVEQSHDLKRYMTRDLNHAIALTEHFGDATKEAFNPSRLEAGAISSLASVLEITGSALKSLSEKTTDLSNKTKEKLMCRTGEVTSAGTLTCKKCQQTLHMKITSHIPPCPKCKATEFSKDY